MTGGAARFRRHARNRTGVKTVVALAIKAAAYLLHHRDRKDRLMIERGIGYWIGPDGEFVPTPPRVSHADIMRELLDPRSLNEDERDASVADPNAFAISKGWSRVRIYPGQQIAYVDYGVGKQQAHARAVADLLDQLGLANIQVKFTDEEGNYVSP
jgi:hypothetical protein